MYRKFRTTIIREEDDSSSDDLSSNSSNESCEEFPDESSFSDYMSEAKTYFPPKERHIGRLFQFSLASTFEKEKYQSPNLELNGDNIMRLKTRWRSRERPQGIPRFMSCGVSIRNPKYIQHLALDFTDEDFRSMIADLAKSFPSVQYLYLNFEKYKNFVKLLVIQFLHREGLSRQFFGDRELIWLSSHITTYMRNLKHLNLRGLWDSITSNGFKKFCSQIGKRLKRLESLTFDFSGDWNIPGDFFKSLTHFATTYLRHLKDFRIISSQVPDSPLEEMRLNKTRYLKQLESLHLYLSPNYTAKSWLHDCREKLKTDLKQLVFFFVPLHHNLLEKGFDFFSSRCLRETQNLKALNLHFDDLQVGSEDAQTFVKAFNTRMKTLEHIKFNSRNCGQMTEAFLGSFECPDNNQLKKLELQFIAEEDKIFKKPMSDFLEKSMQNLKDLTHLDLLFEQVKIKDEQVKTLISCLTENLSKLEFITIQFFICPEITGESVNAFEKAFCSENTLSNLKTLFLTFSSCSSKITQEQVNALETSLQNQKPNIESTISYFEGDKTDSSYEPSDHDESFISDPRCHYDCWKCEYLDPCKRHRWESDTSDVNLTDFIGDKDEDEDEKKNDEDDHNENEDEIDVDAIFQKQEMMLRSLMAEGW